MGVECLEPQWSVPRESGPSSPARSSGINLAAGRKNPDHHDEPRTGLPAHLMMPCTALAVNHLGGRVAGDEPQGRACRLTSFLNQPETGN